MDGIGAGFNQPANRMGKLVRSSKFIKPTINLEVLGPELLFDNYDQFNSTWEICS